MAMEKRLPNSTSIISLHNNVRFNVVFMTG